MDAYWWIIGAIVAYLIVTVGCAVVLLFALAIGRATPQKPADWVFVGFVSVLWLVWLVVIWVPPLNKLVTKYLDGAKQPTDS